MLRGVTEPSLTNLVFSGLESLRKMDAPTDSPVVMLHPSTARQYGLSEGDMVGGAKVVIVGDLT